MVVGLRQRQGQAARRQRPCERRVDILGEGDGTGQESASHDDAQVHAASSRLFPSAHGARGDPIDQPRSDQLGKAPEPSARRAAEYVTGARSESYAIDDVSAESSATKLRVGAAAILVVMIFWIGYYAALAQNTVWRGW